ncbi:MAG: hypothetical protein AAF125_28135 [Chloroflexota bacterium]
MLLRLRPVFALLLLVLGSVIFAQDTEEPAYLDPTRSVDERVDDLLGRMTLDEKIGQMTLIEKGSITPAALAEYGVGAVLSGGGGYPRPNTPAAWHEMVSAYQDAALSTP